MIPRKWTPSDPITAARLNQSQAEAMRPRRDVLLGNGSSMVNEQLGNQAANMLSPRIKLVVALEDFGIPETPTDVAGAIDDVPSGMVREVRLGRKTSTHQDDISSVKFLAYDPAGWLSGEVCTPGSDSGSSSGSESGPPQKETKSRCDVFHVLYNVDSKRWETIGVSSGGGSQWIEFTVVDVYCADDYDNEENGEFYITATVDWYSDSCTVAPFGYDEYTGTVKIFDKCILQYYTPDQLMGLNGHTLKSGLASLMRPFRKATCTPRWLCQSVCGEPVCGAEEFPPESGGGEE